MISLSVLNMSIKIFKKSFFFKAIPMVGFFEYCITGMYEHSPPSRIGSEFVPLISANYDHSEPFGYIIVAIAGLLMIINNIMFLRKYLFRPKQLFLWIFLMWGNFIYFFQLSLVISKYVNRLQLFVAILHNACEMAMFYWIYLAIRDRIRCPFCPKILQQPTKADKIFLWIFTIAAFITILGQIIVTIVFTDLKYAVYAFYLILVGDTLFIGSTITCFITVWKRRDISSIKELTSLFIAVVAHAIYAANDILTCKFTTFTADIALVSHVITICAVTWCIIYVSRIKEDDDYIPISRGPGDTCFC